MRFTEIFARPRQDAVEILRARFAKLRHLLEMNDRVLRLIAAADEHRGGEYLFDAQYLHSLENDLGEAVMAVVYDLAEVSGNRYPGLASAFERVHKAVQATLEPRRAGRGWPCTISIDELGTEFADEVGEKMARLAELRGRLGLRVPDGFVVTARACEYVLGDPSVARQLEQLRQGKAGSAARLREAIQSVHVPTEVSSAIKAALGSYRRSAKFAVRSSAVGEDGTLSFAGQHTTLLNVPRDRVLQAWLEVVASLFSARALEYRVQHRLALPGPDMAVGCLLMVPAVCSGVIFSLDPGTRERGVLVISATRGLGAPLVDGRGVADTFTLSRTAPHRVLSRELRDQREMCVPAPNEGIEMTPISGEQRRDGVVGDETLAALAAIALRVERHMQCPQDIEWAADETGAIVLLQARPLQLGPEARPHAEAVLAARSGHAVLMRGQGDVACRGVAAGPVFVAEGDEPFTGYAPGNVIVSHLAQPSLSAVVATASALVCDGGSVTGHLATVAREYRVPTIVGARNATQLLAVGTTVTVDADDNTIYEGSVDALLRYQLLRSRPYQETPEFRALRRMLRHVAPLHLRDPGARGFDPEQCRTYHDIIRFAHERALVELGRLDGIELDGRHSSARTLDLDIPLDLVVIDLGGGLSAVGQGRSVTASQVTSRPLAILLEGLLTPGVWSTNPAEMDLEGFMASATRAGPLTVAGGDTAVRRNVAIVAADYLNLNIRVGYHFNVVDCCLGKNPEDSYIFFRFVGGVTDSIRRARRARLLATILGRQGLKTEVNGELVVARLEGAPTDLCEDRLRMVGRLIGFSRQLDIVLRDEDAVDRLASAFLEGRYQATMGTLTRSWKMQTDLDVMVLDDESTVCERLKEFLEKSGMKVETFIDSRAALERLSSKRFHVVVTDLKMAGPTGLDILFAVRDQNLSTQVIIITGYPTFEAARTAQFVGAYAFLDKPFRLEALRDLVKKAAKRARKQA
jgi:pyruvate,water dikinase